MSDLLDVPALCEIVKAYENAARQIGPQLPVLRIKALVAQSQKRSAVFDVITNPTNVTVEVN